MTIDRVVYRKIYPLAPYINEAPGFEARLEPDEDPYEALSKLRAITDKWHKDNNQQIFDDASGYFAASREEEKIDTDFEQAWVLVKKRLDEIEFKDDAQEYINSLPAFKDFVPAKLNILKKRNRPAAI